MTNREFLTNVANGTINDEIKAHAAEAIAKIDEANAKRKEKKAEDGKLSKAAEANLPLVDEALTAMGNVAKTSPEIAAELGISIPKANAVLKLGVALSKMTVEDVKVPGKGTIKAYSAVIADEADADVEVDADAE
jgi:hypothetical protein